VLLVFGAPCQHSLLAGREHGRTIPLTDLARASRFCNEPPFPGLASGREEMKLSVRVTALSLAAVVPANHDNEMRDHGLLTS
jgi:hypothetical protein